jgi:hypothetical protein
LRVYVQQPADSFREATVDIDGTWGYHPLRVTLASTGEVLYLANRPGNRPSHEGAHDSIDEAIAPCQRAGFRRVALRGDTDFSQTGHLDRWGAVESVRSLFGMDANAALVATAEGRALRAAEATCQA